MERELTLNDIFVCFKKNFWKILAFAVIAAVLMGCVTHFLIKKKYSSEIEFYVINTNESDDFYQTGILAASSYLANDYIDIINGDDIINKTCKRLEEKGYLNITPDNLRKKLSSSVSQNSSFTLKITDTNPERAYDIATIIAEVAPAMLKDITKPSDRTTSVPIITMLNSIAYELDSYYPKLAEDVRKVSDELKREQSQAAITQELDKKPAVRINLAPQLAKSEDSPNLILNCLVAAVAGAFISFAYFIIRSLLNTLIRTEDDVTKYLSKYPLIGSVPSWDLNEKSGPNKTDYRLNR
jgi:capsular polysaccharide biosynthesis protein